MYPSNFRRFLLFCLLLLWLLAQPGLRKVWGKLLLLPHRTFHKGMVRIPKTAGAKLIGQIVMFCACLLRIFNKCCVKKMFHLRLVKPHLPGVFLQETCYLSRSPRSCARPNGLRAVSISAMRRDLGSLTCPITFRHGSQTLEQSASADRSFPRTLSQALWWTLMYLPK